MRAQVQEIFFKTPHTKQVMMFSATLSQEVRPICRKFCHEKVRPPLNKRDKISRKETAKRRRDCGTGERWFDHSTYPPPPYYAVLFPSLPKSESQYTAGFFLILPLASKKRENERVRCHAMPLQCGGEGSNEMAEVVRMNATRQASGVHISIFNTGLLGKRRGTCGGVYGGGRWGWEREKAKRFLLSSTRPLRSTPTRPLYCFSLRDVE